MPSRLQNLRLAVVQQRAQAPKGSAAAAAAAAAAALAGDTCELSSFQLGEMCRASRPQASIWNFAFTDFAEPLRAETTIPVCQQAAQTPASGKQTHDGLQRHKRCRLIACGHLVMLKLDLKICLTAEMKRPPSVSCSSKPFDGKGNNSTSPLGNPSLAACHLSQVTI